MGNLAVEVTVESDLFEFADWSGMTEKNQSISQCSTLNFLRYLEKNIEMYTNTVITSVVDASVMWGLFSYG